MTDDGPIEDLGYQAFRTAGKLRLLADGLKGMALRCAMPIGNTAMLGELSGRRVRELGGHDR